MKFNLAVKAEADKAFQHLTDLVGKDAIAEVRKVSPQRSLNQNSYLHLLLGYFGQHFGYTLEEAKQIYKEMTPGVYKYKKKNRVFWRSSADLTKDEMTQTIDTLRERSKEAGCPLPPADDPGWLREIENEIERSQHYLNRR